MGDIGGKGEGGGERKSEEGRDRRREREWKGEGKKGMILRGGMEREGVEGGREGEIRRGIKRVEIKIVIRRETLEGGCSRGEKGGKG